MVVLMLAAMIIAAVPVRAETYVWVYKPDKSVQCESDGRSLDDDQTVLDQLGVRVGTRRKTGDGNSHLAACGFPSGSVNAYLIPRSDVDRVRAAGFSLFRPPHGLSAPVERRP